MKRCPECRKDYADDSLMYCLDDGTPLLQGRVADESATVLLSVERVSNEGVTSSSPTATTPRSSGPLPWIIVGVLALVAGFFAYSYFRRSSTGQDVQAVRVAFQPPANLSFNDAQYDSAVISPDGKKIAFSATDANGKNWLYYRELESIEAKQLPGSQNPVEPFWSPDS